MNDLKLIKEHMGRHFDQSDPGLVKITAKAWVLLLETGEPLDVKLIKKYVQYVEWANQYGIVDESLVERARRAYHERQGYSRQETLTT